MDSDLKLVMGVVLIVLAIPSLLSAIIDRRWPLVAVCLIAGGVGLGYYAHTENPGGYTVLEIPDVFLSIVARVL